MKFHQLLHQRDLLLRQARLANVAFAYQRLQSFLARCGRAGLRGTFVLREGDAEDGLPWPTLVAEDASQAVLGEHFIEEDIVELADLFTFVDGGGRAPERRFRLGEIEQSILPALRRELEGAGMPPPEPATSAEGIAERD